MAEVHIIGQIREAKDFPKQRLFCRWHLHVGNNWRHIAGKKEGQTQVSWSQFENNCKWTFPIDIHLSTTGIQGWPKIYIEVYHFDWLGRAHIFGYGTVTVPTSPGSYRLDCYTWRPYGSIKQRFVQYFLGGGLQLKNPDQVFSPGERYKLSTEAMGVVTFDLTMVFRNFTNYVTSTVTLNYNTTDVTSTAASIISSIVTEENFPENSTLCGDNLTLCSNSTEHINVTTVTLTNDTIRREIHRTENTGQEFCTCDLQDGFCDLNCCCDKDCSSENKQVFQYCQTEPRFYDTRYCDYMKYIYINNTPVKWHINENGLFCIVKSNLPPYYIIQRKQPLKTFAESRLERINKFSWRKEFADIEDVFNNSNKLVYGNLMLLVNKRGIHKFGILNSFITNRCLIKEDVFYLNDLNTACYQTEINEDNPHINLKYYFENVYLITNPALVNLTKWKQRIFENCPRNVCLPIIPKICDSFFNNCEVFLKNDSRTTVQCNFTISTKSNVCYNVVKKIKYTIFHDGTKGVNTILLLVILDTVTYEFGEGSPEFEQEFFVNFFWRNTTSNTTNLSGNPGYLTGKPILTSQLLSVKNGTDIVLEIKRNITEKSESILTIPKNINGDCVFNRTDFTVIDFGFNLLTKCKFRTIAFSNKKVVNGTEICRAIQRALLEIWKIKNNAMIGSFGNADRKNLDDWQKIIYKKDPTTLLNNTFGLYSSKNSYIFCSNIVTDLEIDIFHSKIDLGTLLNQEKILGVTLSFGHYTNRSLYFRKNNSSVYFESQIKTTVTFYDLTIKKEKKAVDPPRLDIKLPYDFFYPFIRIDNGGNYFKIDNLFLIISLFVMLAK